MNLSKFSYTTALVYLCTTAACNNENISNNAKHETVEAVNLALSQLKNKYKNDFCIKDKHEHIEILSPALDLVNADEEIDDSYKGLLKQFSVITFDKDVDNMNSEFANLRNSLQGNGMSYDKAVNTADCLIDRVYLTYMRTSIWALGAAIKETQYNKTDFHALSQCLLIMQIISFL